MMTIITPVEEAKAQRRACLNAQLGVDNQDVLEHLQSIQRGSNICDPKGKRIEVIREPWDWIEGVSVVG